MQVIKQVLGRRVTLRKPTDADSAQIDSPWVEYAVDFSILIDEDAKPGCPYRFEWSVPAAPARSGSFAAEDIPDAEDMAFQYFGVKPEEWSVPADAVHTQG